MTLSHLVPIGHLQELGICVPCTLPLGVECELVVTPICTNSFKKNKWRGEVRPCTAKYIQQDQMNIVISQFHNHAQYLKGKNSGGPLDNQTWYTNKSFQSLVLVLTQLHCGQWSSFPFCLPSLIVQCLAKIFPF